VTKQKKGGKGTPPPLGRKEVLLLEGRRNLISAGCVRHSRSSEEEERKRIKKVQVNKVGILTKSGQRLGDRRARDGEGPAS